MFLLGHDNALPMLSQKSNTSVLVAVSSVLMSTLVADGNKTLYLYPLCTVSGGASSASVTRGLVVADEMAIK